METKKAYETPRFTIWELQTADMDLLTASPESEDNIFNISENDDFGVFPE